MPQKRSGFQSKPKFGGQKFGGKGKPRGKPEGGGFGKRFEGDKGGDKPRRPFGDRPAPRGDRPERSSEGRPPRSSGDRPQRSFGDRPDRGGDRPFKKREFGGGDRPERSSGDRPQRSFGDRPRGDRPDRGGDRPFKKREFGGKDSRSFGDRPPRGDRPERGGEGKPYQKRDFGDRGDRPQRSFGDRPDRGGDKPFKKREFGDRNDRAPRGDRPEKPYERSDRPQRTFTRYEDRPQKDAVSFETRQKLKSERAQYGAPSSAFLYGTHAVRAALLNPKRLHQRLLCTQRGFEAIEETLQQALQAGLNTPEVIYVEKEDIERLLPRDAVHQDILLDAQPLEDVFLIDIINAAPENAKILVLDQVTDPHNVGAILRSAAAFGALAVVAQKLHAPDITGTLAKAASGAAEHVAFVREVNLSRALEQLKEAGFFCIGLDEDGKRTIAEVKATGKVAIVLGSEGEGLRRLVAENCDELVKLPTQGAISSLNVSNAAAVALYEAIRAGS